VVLGVVLNAEDDPNVVLVELLGDRLLFALEDPPCVVDDRDEVSVFERPQQRRDEFPLCLRER
jgi:hypothetical protein